MSLFLKQSALKDLLEINNLKDLLGDGGSEEVYNLLLETGFDFLLEDGGFIKLESATL
jgi:hypothetical protein